MVTDNIDVSIIVTNPSISISLTTIDLSDETLIDGGTPCFTKDPISGGAP